MCLVIFYSFSNSKWLKQRENITININMYSLKYGIISSITASMRITERYDTGFLSVLMV